MGLVLSLHKGQDFYVEDVRVVVQEINDDSTFTLRAVNGDPVKVTRDFRVELFPDVFVSASQKVEPDVAKVVIEAPRSIGVILGDLYRHPKPKALANYLFGGNGKGRRLQGAAS